MTQWLPKVCLVLSSVMFSVAWGASIPADGVQVVSPTSTFNVPKYGKLELLVDLTTSSTNPYNPDPASGGIDFYATFTSPISNTVRINGYFDGTNWRIRFAPTILGTWTYTVSASDNAGATTTSSNSFDCVQSIYPGFAQVQGYYLQFTEGQTQVFVGHNNGWQYDVEQPSFASMAAQGENLLSFWMNTPWKTPADPQPRCPIENASQGIGTYNQTACAYLDGVVSRAESAGIYLLPTIWSHGNLRYWNATDSSDPQNHPAGQGWWSNNAYSAVCSATNFFQTSNSGSDTPQWIYQKNYYRYVLARWGYSRAIVGFVALAEIENTTGYGDNGAPAGYAMPAQATAWCGAIRDYFAANDSYRVTLGGKYPIAVTKTDFQTDSETWSNGCDLAADDCYIPQSDTISVSSYIGLETSGGNGHVGMRASNRPAFQGEFGANAPPPYDTLQPEHLHYGIWAGVAAGACICPLLWCDGGYFPTLTDPNIGTQLRSQLQHLSEFVKPIGYFGLPGLSPAAINVNATQFDSFGMQTTDQGFGWIRNTVGLIGGQTMSVSNLSAGRYNLQWFDTWTSGSTPLSLQILDVSGTGVLSAIIPALSREDIAFKFFLNSPPTLIQGALASPSPVTGLTTVLSVAATDDAGESGLVYLWTVNGSPPGPVAFSVNNSNAAKNTTASFSASGSYSFTVTITDLAGASTTSSVSVSVIDTATTISITPNNIQIDLNSTKQFVATVSDQFGVIMNSPPPISWTISPLPGANGPDIDSNGLLAFPQGAFGGGSYFVHAAESSAIGTATIFVVDHIPLVTQPSVVPMPVTGTSATLSATASDDGGEPVLSYTWSVVAAPAGSNVLFAQNGTNAAKNTTATFTMSGNYTLRLTAADLAHQTGFNDVSFSVTQTFSAISISPQNGTVALNTSQIFTATALDQFGSVMQIQPSFSWGANDAQTIDSSGAFLASGAAGGPYTITATSGLITAQTTVTVSDFPPTVISASANPNPATGTTSNLSVSATDDAGESALIYTWSMISAPAGATAVMFPNSSHAAKNAVAVFSASGNYILRVTATDGGSGNSSMDLAITVNQTVTTISVSPASAEIPLNTQKPFVAVANDQFNNPMQIQPSFTWSANGNAIISSTGLFDAGGAAGTYSVSATANNVSGSASVVVKAPPVIVSTLQAVPNPGTTNSPITFSSIANGDALTWQWNFGDGVVAAGGSSITHTFATSGNYTVNAIVSDSFGQRASTQMAIQVVDVLFDPGTVIDGPVASDFPLNVGSLTGVGFPIEPGHDTAFITGVIPGFPLDFAPANKVVTLSIADASVEFVLNKNGASVASNGQFALSLKRINKTGAGSALFKAKLKHGQWSAAWLNAGIGASPLKKQSIGIAVKLTVDGILYDSLLTVHYSVKSDHSFIFSK